MKRRRPFTSSTEPSKTLGRPLKPERFQGDGRHLSALRKRSASARDEGVLAVAAMRASTTALAGISHDQYLARNGRWLRLTGAYGSGWWLLGEDGQAREGTEQASIERAALTSADELSRSGATERLTRYEHRPSGTVVELRLERTRTDDPPLVLATLTDVTSRVRARRELARRQRATEAQERLRAIGELASGLAHDLNNTLHALRLRLSRLEECVQERADRADDLRAAYRIASDAGERVRRLQDLAQRREDVPQERLDLGAAIRSALQAVRLEDDPRRAVRVEVRVPQLPPIVGNGAEIVHVLANLFLNARDAMPDGGRIAVEGTVARDGCVELSVADEGHGIPPENLERIFDPLFTTKGRRGTGLGLSMAVGVMRRLGGSIRVENRSEGGAVFTLTFAPAADPLPRPARRPGGSPPSRRRVLVVDDDPDNLEAMRLVLRERGHEVEVTASGRDAVTRVTEQGRSYEVVLCDLGLGDASGWDVAARISAAAPGTRVVLVTGWAQEIAPSDPRRRYVAGVLPKPLDLEQLDDALAERGDGQAGRAGRAEASADGEPSQLH